MLKCLSGLDVCAAFEAMASAHCPGNAWLDDCMHLLLNVCIYPPSKTAASGNLFFVLVNVSIHRSKRPLMVKDLSQRV